VARVDHPAAPVPLSGAGPVSAASSPAVAGKRRPGLPQRVRRAGPAALPPAGTVPCRSSSRVRVMAQIHRAGPQPGPAAPRPPASRRPPATRTSHRPASRNASNSARRRCVRSAPKPGLLLVRGGGARSRGYAVRRSRRRGGPSARPPTSQPKGRPVTAASADSNRVGWAGSGGRGPGRGTGQRRGLAARAEHPHQAVPGGQPARPGREAPRTRRVEAAPGRPDPGRPGGGAGPAGPAPRRRRW